MVFLHRKESEKIMQNKKKEKIMLNHKLILNNVNQKTGYTVDDSGIIYYSGYIPTGNILQSNGEITQNYENRILIGKSLPNRIKNSCGTTIGIVDNSSFLK